MKTNIEKRWWGNSVKVLKTVLRKIEKTLEQNLTFDIYKHINDN